STARNITMIPALLGAVPALDLYWTLLLEMIFYALISALFALGLLRSTLFTAAALLCVALIGGGIVPAMLGVPVPPSALAIQVDLAMMFVGGAFCRVAAG